MTALIDEILRRLDALEANTRHELAAINRDTEYAAEDDYAEGWVNASMEAAGRVTDILNETRQLGQYIREETQRTQPAIEVAPGQLPLLSEDHD